MTPYQKNYLLRESIYNAIKIAFDGDESIAAVTDNGLSLFLDIEGKGFKIISEMRNNYSKLFFTVYEEIPNKQAPETVSLNEISELNFRNEELSGQYGRMIRSSFIGSESHAVNIADIGNEFKHHLLEYLNK